MPESCGQPITISEITHYIKDYCPKLCGICPDQTGQGNVWVALHEKVPNVLSRCHDTNFLEFFGIFFFFFFFCEKSVSYQKKGGRGPACPSFFWYDNDSGYKGPFRVTQPISVSCLLYFPCHFLFIFVSKCWSICALHAMCTTCSYMWDWLDLVKRKRKKRKVERCRKISPVGHFACQIENPHHAPLAMPYSNFFNINHFHSAQEKHQFWALLVFMVPCCHKVHGPHF